MLLGVECKHSWRQISAHPKGRVHWDTARLYNIVLLASQFSLWRFTIVASATTRIQFLPSMGQ